jgi:formamidopyrimidine-DNA glycosylase
MPENAEVALTAEMLNKYTGSYLLGFAIIGGRYARHKLPGLDTALKYMPCRLHGVHSHGKFLWMEFSELFTETTDILLDQRLYLLNTLGLEGRWSETQLPNSRLKFWFYDPVLKKMNTIWWSDQRNFGTIVFTDDSNLLNRKLLQLAPDLLFGNHTLTSMWTSFNKIIQTKKWPNKPIVELLMDQSALVAGIGNYLSVEILYKARLSPSILAKYIDRYTFTDLYTAMCQVAAASYYGNCTRYISHFGKYKPQRMPLIDYYPGKGIIFTYKVYQQKTADGGKKVIGDRILSNRDSKTYWCPEIQRDHKDLALKTVCM